MSEHTSTAACQPRRSTTPRTCWNRPGSKPASCSPTGVTATPTWRHTVGSAHERDAAHRAISRAVADKAAASPWPPWWTDTVEPMLRLLPDTGILVGQRRQLVEGFTAHMVPAGMDRFAAAGMAATWWEQTFHELQTAANRGWKAVIEAWLTTAEASQDDKKAPNLTDQTAIKILAAPQLAKLSNLATEHTRLNTEIKTIGASKDHNQPNQDILSPTEIKKLKSARTKTKKQLKTIEASLLAAARQTLDTMAPADAPVQAIGVLRTRIEKLVTDHYATIERSVLAWHDNLTDKYGDTLRDLETHRDNAATHLEQHLEELGYG